jgi:transcriptional regulator with XRE-family HTH domain
MGDLQRTVGRNLRTYRQARGLSQEAFADVLGFHRTYMGAVERGERNLTLKSVERIVGRLTSTRWSCFPQDSGHQTTNFGRSRAGPTDSARVSSKLVDDVDEH